MIMSIAASFVGALGYGVGSVLQAKAAKHSNGLSVLWKPYYIAGIALDLIAWAASLIALHNLPLFAVQAILASSLGVTIILSHWVLNSPIRRRDIGSIMIVFIALTILSLSAGTQGVNASPSHFSAFLFVSLAALGGLISMSYKKANSLWFAGIAGFSFALAALAGRALNFDGNWLHVLIQPEAFFIVAFGVMGSIAYSRSLVFGSPGAATAMLWVVEVAVAGVAGLIVLGDTVKVGWHIPSLIAFFAAILSCGILGSSSANQPEKIVR